MTIFFYVISSLLLAAIVFFILSFFAIELDSLIRGHDIPTSKQAAKAIIGVIKDYGSEGKNFYDLGCSRGSLSLAMKKSLPGLKICGVDNSPIKIFFAKLRSKIFGRKIDFKKKDIFALDLSRADIVYAYLWYDLMPRLERKLKKELKRGSIVITNTTSFPNWRPNRKIITSKETSRIPDFETIFIYFKK